MYSSLVTQYLNPDELKTFSHQTTGYTCYSSWHSRNDIANIANITGPVELSPLFKIENINDGFFCVDAINLSYLSHSSKEGWVQADLIKQYKLKCVRLGVFQYFEEIEIRFGNYTRDQGLKLNSVVAYQETKIRKSIVEYCLDRPIVGKYLLIEKYRPIGFDMINIGALQIIVE